MRKWKGNEKNNDDKSFNQDACPPNDPDYPLRMGEKPKNRIVEMRYKIETRKVWICYHS